MENGSVAARAVDRVAESIRVSHVSRNVKRQERQGAPIVLKINGFRDRGVPAPSRPGSVMTSDLRSEGANVWAQNSTLGRGKVFSA